MRISDLSSDVCSSDLREAARQKELLAEGISSQNKYDQAVLAAQNARSAILNTRQANQSVAAQLTGSVDAPIDRQPAFPQAQAALEREIGRATSELQSLMRISYAVFCLKKKKT